MNEKIIELVKHAKKYTVGEYILFCSSRTRTGRRVGTRETIKNEVIVQQSK